MKREGIDIRAGRLDEAAEWLLRLEQPSRTEADYTDWLRWCDADQENLAAFETVQHKWQAFYALKADPALSQFSASAESQNQELELDLALMHAQERAIFNREADRLFDAVPRRKAGEEGVGRHSRQRPARARTGWLIAAGLSAATLALTISHYQSNVDAEPAQQVAAVLTKRAATLPDGSRMILGTQSRVDVNFNGPQRRLDLSSGEAYFKVKHDKSRPFVVRAGDVNVIAVGTAFDVRRGKDKVTITVEEGTVEVASSEPDGKRTVWRAEAGYQITYSTAERTASIASIDPTAELAWRKGDLAYRYESLGVVIEDLNRYSTRRIVIADPRVAEIPFTGTAFASALDGWLAGIEQAYPVTVRRTSNGDIILDAKE